MQEARGYGGRAARFRGVTQHHIVGAEHLREVVRRQSDTPFRQIEAEAMPHRAAKPRIDARRWRPDAFNEAAKDDAIRLREPRFERAIDSQQRIADLRPAHHAIRERGFEDFGVVGKRDRKFAHDNFR